MKNIILFVIASLVAAVGYSAPKDVPGGKVIIFEGNMGIVNNVRVSISENTLITSFDKDMDNAKVTVKKKSGEVVSEEYLDAREFDEVRMNIPNYKEGEYNIEISSPKEGTARGNF